ncbi:caspase, EACC1-associated type [Mastigocoleus testarum]|uniref:Sulfatase-modifying factor protein n=1 Tax=Mastigocoleus testarum BC008 TaxID=371196 RepID=A0A0V7ZUC3_9CYAN|nr:SUMF1/EgtB/PvdO family nonheme iron enzyme [Mastigocoleus testarum]KST68224.1 sulfatase-modifying factor protein [Mastigocoleus testarum BC008]
MAKFALLIGVSEYQKELKPLPAAVNDVEAMRRVLVNPEMGGFAESDIEVLTNPQPQKIRDAIFQLFLANRQKNDLLLFYFSGHGIKDDRGKLYLSSCETHKEYGRLVKPSAIAANYLHENINDSRSQRQVIILDCCFSGAIAQGMTVKDDGNVDLQAQLGGKGRAILTSSSSTQYSFEQEDLELSIYTKYLVEGIETGAADKDEDGQISADELHEYARSKVQEASPAMTPKFYPVEEGHKIFLAKSPQDDPKLKYRKEVETRAEQSRGNISPIVLGILELKREELKLSPEEANTIKEEVLQPYRDYKRKLDKYEQDLRDAINQEYPFNENTKKDLKEYQQDLGLRDEDIASIEKRIIAPKQTEYQRQQQEEGKKLLQQIEAEKQRQEAETKKLQQQRGAERKKQEAEKLRQQQVREKSQSFSIIQTQQFEFETATIVNVKPGFFGIGKTCEINHSRKTAKYFTEELGNGVVLEMVEIPGGKFMMGTEDEEIERLVRKFHWNGYRREKPRHQVTVKPFFMGKYPVTQAQWKAVAALPKVNRNLKPEPSKFKEDDRPVERVSWYDAVEFCDRLSHFVKGRLSSLNTDIQYRLPSEAEWEYVCRAHTTTPFHCGETITGELANYRASLAFADEPKGECREQTIPVGQFPANAFGLYDMQGNVWEWCADDFHDSYQGAPTDGSAWVEQNNDNDNRCRVLRGGSWGDLPVYCRSAYRGSSFARSVNTHVGLRVVCVAVA